MAAIEIKVPDIGDFKDVPVIEVLVKPGDAVKQEDSLVTLESDKATMEVPSTHAGVVKEVRVKVGDKVSQGTVIAVLDAEGAEKAAPAPAAARTAAPAAAPESREARRGRAAAGARPGSRCARRSTRRWRAWIRTSTPRCSCSAPGPAATPPRSAPPTSA